MIALLLALFGLVTPTPDSPIGLCDPVDGPRVKFSKADRDEVFVRLERACIRAGDSPEFCEWIDMVAFRESRGRSSVRHTRAEGENGIGALGLSIRWQAHRWPGDADPDFCLPEVSYVVAREIAIKAVRVYHAQTYLDVQAVYSGRVGKSVTPNGNRYNFAAPTNQTARISCGGLAKRGIRCHDKLPADFLAPSMPLAARRKFVEGLLVEAAASPTGPA